MITYCSDCDRNPAWARGLCGTCYHKAREAGTLPRVTAPRGDCRICGIRAVAHGLCMTHYQRLRRYGTTGLAREGRPVVCSVEDCGRPIAGRGWCKRHYVRWQRHGDPLHAA
jgi:hypothetical protein